jgi:hypothetical protein
LGETKRIFVRKREIRRRWYVRRFAAHRVDAGIKNWRYSELFEAANQCPVLDMIDLDQCGLAGLGRKFIFCPGVQGTNWTQREATK